MARLVANTGSPILTPPAVERSSEGFISDSTQPSTKVSPASGSLLISTG